MTKCPTCYGTGFEENVHLYFGRCECPTCDGLGIGLESICCRCQHTLEEHQEDYWITCEGEFCDEPI